MKLCVAVFALAVFLLIMALFSRLGEEMDNKKRRLDEVKNAQSGTVKQPSPQKKQKKPLLMFSLRQKNRIRKNEKRKSDGNKKNAETENKLEMAGLYITAEQFSLVKLLVAVVLLMASYFICPLLKLDPDMTLLCYLGALAMGLLLPQKLVEVKIKKKKEGYLNELPDIMDLLCVSVEAGLGFDAALSRLYEKSKTPLMEEFMVAQRDIRHGISKKTAYTNMSERCDIKELTAFLNAMLQAEDLGVSIKSVLKTQAELLRDDRRQKAEEKALKAPVTMLLPMVIFIFPVIFIVLLGPAAMNMMDLL